MQYNLPIFFFLFLFREPWAFKMFWIWILAEREDEGNFVAFFSAVFKRPFPIYLASLPIDHVRSEGLHVCTSWAENSVKDNSMCFAQVSSNDLTSFLFIQFSLCWRPLTAKGGLDRFYPPCQPWAFYFIWLYTNIKRLLLLAVVKGPNVVAIIQGRQLLLFRFATTTARHRRRWNAVGEGVESLPSGVCSTRVNEASWRATRGCGLIHRGKTCQSRYLSWLRYNFCYCP